MTITEFNRLVETFGADTTRWPEEIREAAATLLASSAEARASRDRAATLDAALQRYPTAISSSRKARVVDAVLHRIAAAPPRASPLRWYPDWLAAFIPPAPAALAVLALIGCLIGLQVPLPRAAPQETMVTALGSLLSGNEGDPL